MNKENLKELMSVIDESVRLLNNNLERAANLVKNFKQLAVDQSSGSLARFDLKENMDGVIISLFHEYKNLPVTIENHCPNHLFLNTFPGATSQIITNLIMNSLHHGLKDRLAADKLAGKIDIFAIQKEDWIQIIYVDNGKGISKENLKKMYDPFFTTNRVNGNSGLGMHIVLSLVTQKLKGNIHCESEVGEGVKFTIEFPMELESKSMD
jgi:signal transduction histidine kinase